MANLTLNFADASFDGSDDYYIDPSDGFIYRNGIWKCQRLESEEHRW